MRNSAAVLSIIGLVLAASGCSGSEASPEPVPTVSASSVSPDSDVTEAEAEPESGFHTLEEGRLRVNVPDAWVPGEFYTGESWNISLQDEAGEADPKVRLVATSNFPSDHAGMAISRLKTMSVFGASVSERGFSRLINEDYRQMHRWDFTFGDDGRQGVAWTLDEGTTKHVVAVAVLAVDGLDERTVELIEESIEILP